MQEFKDSDKISLWAMESINAMQQYGLMKGDENGNFNPKAVLNQGEAAVMIMRLREAILSN